MSENINVVVLQMEYGMHGIACLNHDGSITVFLNSRDSHERQMEAYKHEMKHIKRRDFEKHDVQTIELEAHKKKTARLTGEV